MMLVDRPQEQETLFKEIIFKKLNVREAEGIARNIAVERARKLIDHELIEIEDKFKEKLGTRVRIEKKEDGGTVKIDFFNKDDLRAILDRLDRELGSENAAAEAVVEEVAPLTEEEKILAEDKPAQDEDEDLYSVSNFSI